MLLYDKVGLSSIVQIMCPPFLSMISLEWPLLLYSTSILFITIQLLSKKIEAYSIALFFLGPHQNHLEQFPITVQAFSSMDIKTLLAFIHYPAPKPLPHLQEIVSAVAPFLSIKFLCQFILAGQLINKKGFISPSSGVGNPRSWYQCQSRLTARHEQGGFGAMGSGQLFTCYHSI